MTHKLEILAHLAALHVALLKAGMLEADRALWEWSADWIQVDEEELEDVFDTPVP